MGKQKVRGAWHVLGMDLQLDRQIIHRRSNRQIITDLAELSVRLPAGTSVPAAFAAVHN